MERGYLIRSGKTAPNKFNRWSAADMTELTQFVMQHGIDRDIPGKKKREWAEYFGRTVKGVSSAITKIRDEADKNATTYEVK